MSTVTTEPVELPSHGHYRLATSRCTARFVARSLFGLVRVPGTFSVRSGEVTVENGQAQVTAHLDPATVCTGNKRRDKDLRSARFLDVERAPDLAFEGSLGTGDSTMTGWLTVCGETVSCELRIRQVTRHGEGVDVVAATRLDRYAYGITAGRGLISRDVDVEITIALIPVS